MYINIYCISSAMAVVEDEFLIGENDKRIIRTENLFLGRMHIILKNGYVRNRIRDIFKMEGIRWKSLLRRHTMEVYNTWNKKRRKKKKETKHEIACKPGWDQYCRRWTERNEHSQMGS